VPTTRYLLKDGTRVPGTTTIIGKYKESGGLIHWAWQQGVDGLDYRKTRDAAADAGTLGHRMFELYLDQVKDWELAWTSQIDLAVEELQVEDREVIQNAKTALESAVRWWEIMKAEVVDQEMHLVSEEWRFGGTPDAILRIDGKLALADWKTSKRIYHDTVLQVAAYRHLWEHVHPDQPLESFHVCRFDKEMGNFTHHNWPKKLIDLGWKKFKLLRRAYDVDAKLKKVSL